MCDIVASGGGQYGDVYEGMWKRYNKIVAVKTLKVSETLVAAILTLAERITDVTLRVFVGCVW